MFFSRFPGLDSARPACPAVEPTKARHVPELAGTDVEHLIFNIHIFDDRRRNICDPFIHVAFAAGSRSSRHVYRTQEIPTETNPIVSYLTDLDGAGPFTKSTDVIFEPGHEPPDGAALETVDESLVIDSRSALSPAQLVENKLTRILRDASMPVSHIQVRLAHADRGIITRRRPGTLCR